MFGVSRSRILRIMPSAALLAGLFLCATPAFADRFTSPNYTIDASTANNFGGTGTSTSYNLTSSGGESIVGNGSGGSYKLTQGYVAQLEKSIQLNVQPSGLTNFFPLDEGVGTTAWDSSSNNTNGNLVGPTWVNGKIGGALNFNPATNNYTEVLDSPTLPSGQKATFSIWANQDALLANATLLSHWDYDLATRSGSWAIQTGADSTRLRVFIADLAGDTGGNYVDSPVNSWPVTSWVQMIAVYDGTLTNTDRVKIYINGVKQTTTTTGTIVTSLLNSTGPFRIGDFKGLNRYFNGKLDHVKLMNRALTDLEVKAEYDAQNVGNDTGLSLNTITPGASQIANFDTIVQTDASGYTLFTNQNQNLTSGANTIPAVSGTIATPLTWSEGSTKGLGFSLAGTNATALPVKWGAGTAFAAFPNTSTSFYSRSGYTGGAKDIINMRLRADAISSQPIGAYTNVTTILGTMTP